jgi:transcriptional regulator with GAF, ATPase, and Fis domain
MLRRTPSSPSKGALAWASLYDLDRKKIRAALKAAHGVQSRAAKTLGVPRTTLQKWLTAGPLRHWRRYVDNLRRGHAPRAHGRPWKASRNRTRAAVARAWKAASHRLDPAARLLGIPRTSLRHLLHRYQLPNLPAPGRKRSARRR